MAVHSDHKTFLTEEGLQKATEELRYLKTEKRKLIAEKIESAKELGDLSENAEYTDAKDEQAFTEARIAELEGVLKHAEVVASHTGGGIANIGSQVRLRGENGEKIYNIVGFNEANPADGKISNESPMGQALLGKRVGDAVKFKAPSGEKIFEVIEVS